MSNRDKIYKRVANPGKIANREHADHPGSRKETEGTGAYSEILLDSTVVKKVLPDTILRVANTTGVTQFVWLGEVEGDAPLTPAITDSIAIPPNSREHIFVGISELNKEGCSFVKTSDAGVQVAIIKE